VNECICHGIPDQRKLLEGDIINIGPSVAIPHPATARTRGSHYHSRHAQTYRSTRTVRVLTPLRVRVACSDGAPLACEGFHGDANGTYPVGRIDEESKKLIRTTRQCLDEAIKLCKPGTLVRDLGKTMCARVFPARSIESCCSRDAVVAGPS
jgi:methionyl aminopeptidase